MPQRRAGDPSARAPSVRQGARSAAGSRCRSPRPPRRPHGRTAPRSGPHRASAGPARSRPGHGADPPAQVQPQPPRAHVVQGELAAQPVEQAGQPAMTSLCRPIGFGQCHPHPEMRRLGFGRHRFRLHPQRLIQPQHQPRPEPPGQRRSRQGDEIGNPRQADPVQRLGGVMVDAQRRDRQMPDALGQPILGHDAAAMPGQRMRRPPRPAIALTAASAGPRQPGIQVAAQLCLAAEEMRDPGDVGDQPVRALRSRPSARSATPSAAGPPAPRLRPARSAGRVIRSGQIARASASGMPRCRPLASASRFRQCR